MGQPANNLPPRFARFALYGLLLAALLSACHTPGKPAPTLFNPLNALNGADPWLQYYDGNYYLTATQWSAIRMWKSPTLAGLATVEPTTIWTDSTPSRCCNVWAPEFHLLDGPDGQRWYVYYTAGTDGTLDNQRMHVLESSGADPLGPYAYKGQIGDPTNNGWAIDGSVLTMPDGRLYFLFSSWVGPEQSLFVAPMSNPWTISGERVLISRPTLAWERSQGNVNEGPVALQHGDKTFIVYSASACWGPDYKLGMLAYNGGDVLDAASWEKHPDPVFQRSDANSVYGPGHNGFFSSPDGKENWIVYHANAAAGDGCTGERTTRVQKFTWNDDGTPNFSMPVSLDTAVAPPSGERGETPQTAKTVRYALVNKNNGQCLVGGSADDEVVQFAACDEGESQQWSMDYLANGHYRFATINGQALEAAAQNGAQIRRAEWAHGSNQQWRVEQTGEGWLRIEARESDKVLGACGPGTGVEQASWQEGNDCQQFRLQPIGSVEIVNANSVRVLTVDTAGTEDGANVVQASDGDAANQRWRFIHQEDGYYQVVADHSDKCLSISGDARANGANIDQQACGSGEHQQWRFDPLNDGMLRLVERESGKVAEVGSCRMADGANVQEWLWLDNMCQRFYFTAS